MTKRTGRSTSSIVAQLLSAALDILIAWLTYLDAHHGRWDSVVGWSLLWILLKLDAGLFTIWEKK
jgi:hypothetical protein